MAPRDRWLEGAVHILAAFAKHGAAANQILEWTGRWWRLLGAIDLVPMEKKVVIAVPSLPNPFTDASEISITGEDHGRVTLANGLARHGEEVRRIRGSNGEVAEVWIGDARFLPESEAAAELEEHYRS